MNLKVNRKLLSCMESSRIHALNGARNGNTEPLDVFWVNFCGDLSHIWHLQVNAARDSVLGEMAKRCDVSSKMKDI